MPQIRLTGDCMEEYWWRGFDFETFRKETMSIYYDLEKVIFKNSGKQELGKFRSNLSYFLIKLIIIITL